MRTVADRRETRRVGKCGRLEVVFGRRRQRTVLAHAYAEPPFRTPRCFDEHGALHMIMASSAPGIFGGDHLEQTVILEAGAEVRLTSQSAAQIHPHPSGHPARVRSEYRVAAGASLRCDWDALIPFAGAVLDQQIVIDLACGACLFWSDAVMSGRTARAEQWRFEALAHQLRIVRGGEIEYLERYRIRPAVDGILQRWIGASAAYFGTAVVSGRRAGREDAERLHCELSRIEGVHAAADLLGEALLVVRLMSESGIEFRKARALIGRMMG
jgi:urease accessory protein UreH